MEHAGRSATDVTGHGRVQVPGSENPNWDYKTLNPDSDFPLAEKAIRTSMDATNPNLKPFVDHGGKLLMYHGWSDPGIPPLNTVQYYKTVVDTLGGTAKAMNSIRLFMIPGMNHCQGGNGTDKFDGIAALSQWVEKGKAPERIPHHIRPAARSIVRGRCAPIRRSRLITAAAARMTPRTLSASKHG